MISATIASGSSERGLSDVTIVWSARRAEISPISGRLPRSRSPPQPNTHSTRPLVSGRGRAQHVLQRVGRVGVVDENGEVLALVDGLETAGHAARRPAARRRSSSSSTPSARAAATAPSTLRTLKRPGSGERSARPPATNVEPPKSLRISVARRSAPGGVDGDRDERRLLGARGQLVREPLAVGIVDVDDRDRRVRPRTAAASRRSSPPSSGGSRGGPA